MPPRPPLQADGETAACRERRPRTSLRPPRSWPDPPSRSLLDCCRSCRESRPRGVAGTYVVFDMPAICARLRRLVGAGDDDDGRVWSEGAGLGGDRLTPDDPESAADRLRLGLTSGRVVDDRLGELLIGVVVDRANPGLARRGSGARPAHSRSCSMSRACETWSVASAAGPTTAATPAAVPTSWTICNKARRVRRRRRAMVRPRPSRRRAPRLRAAPRATVAAASASGTWCTPCSASRTSVCPHGDDRRNRARRSRSSVTSSARTSSVPPHTPARDTRSARPCPGRGSRRRSGLRHPMPARRPRARPWRGPPDRGRPDTASEPFRRSSRCRHRARSAHRRDGPSAQMPNGARVTWRRSSYLMGKSK